MGHDSEARRATGKDERREYVKDREGSEEADGISEGKAFESQTVDSWWY